MRFFTVLLLTTLLLSCKHRKAGPDVSAIPADVKIERLEDVFFRIDTNALQAGLQQASDRFPQFFPFYLRQLLRVTPESPELKQILASYRPLYDSLRDKYRDLSWLKAGLENGFRHVKYYYPDYAVPRVITYIATFDAPGTVLTPQYLGIGLHQYAGKHFSAYGDAQLQEIYPLYISRRFDREYMTANCLKAVVDDLYPDSSAGRPLIEQMVQKGKQWYLLDHFLPDAPDSVKTGYTQKQLDWINRNEGAVWGYFTSNVDLYTIDPAIVQDYIGEAPFTRGMPEGFSPGNIGQWVGWRIVQRFAEKNEGLSLQQVLSTPARAIFEGAKYKPK